MDAASDVEREAVRPRATPEGVEQTADVLREEIKLTSKVLHEHVDELRDRLRHGIDSVRNPFGFHDRVEEYPLTACGLAFVAGLAVGVLKGRPHLRGVAGKLGGSVGSSIAGQVASRVVDRLAGSITPWV